jgi:hypothetical protein
VSLDLNSALGVSDAQLARHAPASSTRLDAAPAQVTRWDGWSNLLTGHGTTAKDSRVSTTFTPDVVTPDEGIQLQRGDDIAGRVVETWPNEMLREGYGLRVKLDGDQQGDADAAKEIVERIEARWDDLALTEKLWDCLAWERGQGGAALLLGANDGQGDLSQEMIPSEVTSLDFITAIEPTELTPATWYDDPLAHKYGEVATWRLTPAAGIGVGVSSRPGIRSSTIVHESRLIIFPGIRVTRRHVGALSGWGDSVFTRMRSVLRDHNMSWESAAVLIQQFAPAVMKIKGLMEMVANDQGDVFINRLKAVALARSTIGATLLDSEEDYQRQSTPVTGLPDLLDRFMSRLAAAADMPLTLLMGQSPGGLSATGESDIRFFYDRISAAQRKRLKPIIERVTRLIMRAEGIEEPEKWSVFFNPLWQLSEKENADARKTQAETDVLYIQNGVVMPDDIARSRYGGDEYSFDTSVDFRAREEVDRRRRSQRTLTTARTRRHSRKTSRKRSRRSRRSSP